MVNRKEYHAKWYEENKESFNEKRRLKYKELDSEAIKKKVAEYKANNKEKIREQSKEYRKNNREKVRSKLHDYRARKRGAFVEKIDFKVIYEKDNGICYLCGKPVNMNKLENENIPADYGTIDHVIPIIAGGLHEYTNIRLAHLSCNGAKSDRIIEGSDTQLKLVLRPEKYQPTKEDIAKRKKEYLALYRKENKKKIDEKTKEYRKANIEKVREQKRNNYHKNKPEPKPKPEKKPPYKPSPEKGKQYSAEYRERHREAINKRRRENRLAKKLK
jgi:5-methylcytosine-specific restriction endonuclease McrA